MLNREELMLAQLNGVLDKVQNQEIVRRIRTRYSEDDEMAILRKKIANLDLTDEFTTYNDFVENTKREVKKEVQEILYQ